ncbi:MAG: 4Fe-4S binding protein [Deltaproteobacteria bacterium]|nr:4Fe-4S binding protein [Deltaproteobacteria bacterium]
MDPYGKLQELLDKHIIGAPKSPLFDEILRTMFSEDEARVALGMNFRPRTVSVIARESGVPEQDAAGLLDAMASRGVAFCREKDGQARYALLPTIPGLFEFPFMGGGNTPTHDKLARLWNQYHDEALNQELTRSATPYARIIPVEQAVESRNEVMPFEALSAMMQKSEVFAVAHCACRLTMKKCQKPQEVCLVFDQGAKFLAERDLAREITREEALAVLTASEEAGLVHTTNNSGDRLTFVCNCCPCCCTILRGWTLHENPNAFAKSRWLARADESLCSECGACAEERCPMGAVSLENGAARVDEPRCIGCGLCTTTCETGAMTLVPRPGAPAPHDNIVELGLTIAKEKGKLDEFLEMMKP